MNAGGVRVGDTTVVYGVGGVGINAVQGAASGGRQVVIAVDPVEFKREAALSSAPPTSSPRRDAVATITALTWGQMSDSVLSPSGFADENDQLRGAHADGKGGTS